MHGEYIEFEFKAVCRVTMDYHLIPLLYSFSTQKLALILYFGLQETFDQNFSA